MELQALVLIPNIAKLGQKVWSLVVLQPNQSLHKLMITGFFPAIPTWKDQFGAPNILLGVILFHEEKSRA